MIGGRRRRERPPARRRPPGRPTACTTRFPAGRGRAVAAAWPRSCGFPPTWAGRPDLPDPGGSSRGPEWGQPPRALRAGQGPLSPGTSQRPGRQHSAYPDLTWGKQVSTDSLTFYCRANQVVGRRRRGVSCPPKKSGKVLLHLSGPTADRILQRLRGQPQSWNAEPRFNSNGKERS
jgi:hypothetical protein